MANEFGHASAIFLAGRQAFLNREHHNTNPHEEDSVAADEWDAGWGDADDENEGVFNHELDAFAE